MTKQARIALKTVAPLPVVAYFFGSECFSGVFPLLLLFQLICTINHFTTLVTFNILLSALAFRLVSLQSLMCECFITLIADAVGHTNVNTL